MTHDFELIIQEFNPPIISRPSGVVWRKEAHDVWLSEPVNAVLFRIRKERILQNATSEPPLINYEICFGRCERDLFPMWTFSTLENAMHIVDHLVLS